MWKLDKRLSDLRQFCCWLLRGHSPATGVGVHLIDQSEATVWTCDCCGHVWIE